MRMMKSNLKLIVLKILDKKSLSGYGIVKEIHEFTKTWKPSYGSIYPILKNLRENGFLEVKEEGRKKIYRITPKGHHKVQEIIKSKEEIFDHVISNIKNLEMICDKKEINFIYRWHKNMRNNLLPFKNISKEVHELGDLLMIISASPALESHQKEIKELLTETIIKLKKINAKTGNTGKK